MVAVHLKVKRYDPEVDKKPRWQEYEVEVDSKDRVLDALHEAKWHHDGTLTFRRSCAHGVCGSDAMVINGQNGLACGQLIENVGTDITLEPIRGLPVIKDLVVDMEPFFAQYRSILPVPHQRRRPGLQGALPVSGRPRAVRRHDEVHPVRLLHDVVPGVLGQLVVRGTGGDRERAPVHLRLARRGGRAASRHPEREVRRLPLPHRVQLHRRLPPRHQGHPGHRRGEAGALLFDRV